MARVCRYCKARCHGECPEARAAHERYAVRQRADLEQRQPSERVRATLAALTPQQAEELFR